MIQGSKQDSACCVLLAVYRLLYHHDQPTGRALPCSHSLVCRSLVWASNRDCLSHATVFLSANACALILATGWAHGSDPRCYASYACLGFACRYFASVRLTRRVQIVRPPHHDPPLRPTYLHPAVKYPQCQCALRRLPALSKHLPRVLPLPVLPPSLHRVSRFPAGHCLPRHCRPASVLLVSLIRVQPAFANLPIRQWALALTFRRAASSRRSSHFFWQSVCGQAGEMSTHAMVKLCQWLSAGCYSSHRRPPRCSRALSLLRTSPVKPAVPSERSCGMPAGQSSGDRASARYSSARGPGDLPTAFATHACVPWLAARGGRAGLPLPGQASPGARPAAVAGPRAAAPFPRRPLAPSWCRASLPLGPRPVLNALPAPSGPGLDSYGCLSDA